MSGGVSGPQRLPAGRRRVEEVELRSRRQRRTGREEDDPCRRLPARRSLEDPLEVVRHSAEGRCSCRPSGAFPAGMRIPSDSEAVPFLRQAGCSGAVRRIYGSGGACLQGGTVSSIIDIIELTAQLCKRGLPVAIIARPLLQHPAGLVWYRRFERAWRRRRRAKRTPPLPK